MKRTVKIISIALGLIILASALLVGCKNEEVLTDDDTTSTQEGFFENNEEPAEETGPLVIYPEFDERIERDYMYSVSVTQGDKTASIPVYNHTEASRTTRSNVDTSADEFRRFSTFAFDPTAGGVRVDIKVNCDFESYSLIPSAKSFRNEFYKGVISVYLDKPDYFMVRLNGKDSTLIAIFADSPETDIPEANDNTIVVDGWKDVEGGVLELKKDGTTLYIKPGAVLNARVKVTADNCKIIGRGAILDPFSDIYNYDEKETKDYVLLYIHNADNTVVDGIHLLNGRAYNLEIQGIWERAYADNARITNTKILSTQMSSDGMMFNYYIRDAYAEHCFIYCGDNALNYEDEAHFKDILVGTTCNAIFPQTDIRNSSLEDIYVFRADDNIINAEYGGSNNQTIVDNSTITNLYALDVTYTSSFLLVENETGAVVPYNGGFTIKNVYLPEISGIKSKFYYNIAPANYQIRLENVSVNGKLIESITPSFNNTSKRNEAYVFPDESWGWIGYPEGHEFSYSTTADFNYSVKPHRAIVNYKNEQNVFVGSYQIFYKLPVIKSADDILLPLDQTKAELRTDAIAAVIEYDGNQYVSANTLVSSGMAKEIKTEANNLIITPKYTGENLILPDSGIISQFTEIRASHMEIVANREGDSTVLHITGDAGNKSDVIGIHYLLNEAVKKYGPGDYRVTFKAKSTGLEQIKVTVGYGMESTVHRTSNINIGSGWLDCSMDFSVAQNIVNQAQIRLTITASWADVSEFDIKDICIIKVS